MTLARPVAGRPGEALGRGLFDKGLMFSGAGELRGASALDDAALGVVKREGALERLRPALSEKAQQALAQQSLT